MKIGIIVAMNKELNLLLPLLEAHKEEEIDGTRIYKGFLGPHEVAIVQSGIGKVNAAMGAVALINVFHPDFVINTGGAGGTGSAARIMDVVLADRVAYHDVWCGPCGAEPGQVQGMPRFFEGSADIIARACLNESLDIKVGLIASGDQFIDSKAALDNIKKLYPDVLAVDMESAPIAQVCHIKEVPFISLRVVSDTPGEADNSQQYEHFWDDAPQQTFKVLVSIINSL